MNVGYDTELLSETTFDWVKVLFSTWMLDGLSWDTVVEMVFAELDEWRVLSMTELVEFELSVGLIAVMVALLAGLEML